MTDWRAPSVITAEDVALVKLMHILGGAYIWEFISNLDYEYSVITGKRKFTWTFPLYVGCRWCPLFAIISQFLGFDVSNKINCHAWVIAAFMFGYLSFAFASALIVLRVVAIWNRNKIVIALALVLWLANTASYIYCAVTSVAVWNYNTETCVVLHTEHSRIGIFSTLASDLALLVLMLVGLLRWKYPRQRCGIWQFLRTQGLIWVLLVTLAEVPPTVFILLNLNAPLNLMFQVLALIIMAIGASRLYRGLADHPALSRNPTKATASDEWSNERSSVPRPRASSHKVCLPVGTPTTGGAMLAPNGQPSTTFDSEVRDDDIV